MKKINDNIYVPTIGVVVARYKENIDWLSDLKHTTYLYEKGDIGNGNKLINVGREAHTYLHHIVDKYDTLEDFIIFLQGNPFDHGVINIDHINKLIPETDFIPLNGIISGCIYNESHGKIPSFCEEHNINIKHTDIVRFTPGAQFMISKETIKKHPLSFYDKLLNTMSNTNSNPNEAHIMERLWGYIFNENF
jgi:hypothetical protein